MFQPEIASPPVTVEQIGRTISALRGRVSVLLIAHVLPEQKIRAVGSSFGTVLLMPLSDDSATRDGIALRGVPHISRIGYNVTDLDDTIEHFASLGIKGDCCLTRQSLRIVHFRPEDSHEMDFQLREVSVSETRCPEFAL